MEIPSASSSKVLGLLSKKALQKTLSKTGSDSKDSEDLTSRFILENEDDNYDIFP